MHFDRCHHLPHFELATMNRPLNERLETSGPVDDAAFADVQHLLSLAKVHGEQAVSDILDIYEKFVILEPGRVVFPKLGDFPDRQELVRMLGSTIPMIGYLVTSLDVPVCSKFIVLSEVKP